ncbi:MAG: hypothetical protein ACRDL5_11265, partial [Solirubrobacteraceae bacterium]
SSPVRRTSNAAALPVGDRALARGAAAASSEQAFHLGVGIATGLLAVAAVGGLGLAPRRRRVAAGGCGAGQFTGQPSPVADAADDAGAPKPESSLSTGRS